MSDNTAAANAERGLSRSAVSVTVNVGADAVSPADVEAVRRGLSRYNLSRLNVPHAPFAVVARDAAGTVLGGVTGDVQWGMCEVEFLWVHDAWRGRGIGRQLMDAAEEVALAHGCRRMHLDTMSFQAPGFYRKLGFVIVGMVDGYADGAVRYVLVKDLVPVANSPAQEGRHE